MSFMFHPNPYKDPRAVNPIDEGREISARMVCGLLPIAKRIAAEIKAGARRVGIDGYPGAEFSVLRRALEQQLPGQICWIQAESLMKSEEEIDAIIAPYLPEDREIDPVLLYGRRYEGGYEGIQSTESVRRAASMLDGEKTVLIIGRGALVRALEEKYDLRVWLDITPK